VSDDVNVIVSCNGEQVIKTSGAISSHMQQCAAIAEIESGENVETSLLMVRDDGASVVKRTDVLYKRDPLVDVVIKRSSNEEKAVLDALLLLNPCKQN
jgi:hypothetical protein